MEEIDNLAYMYHGSGTHMDFVLIRYELADVFEGILPFCSLYNCAFSLLPSAFLTNENVCAKKVEKQFDAHFCAPFLQESFWLKLVKNFPLAEMEAPNYRDSKLTESIFCDIKESSGL